MATLNGAYATFDDKERGSLEAGKIADMVILSDNPYTVPADSIKDIKVEELILGGRRYESARTSLLDCIWRGFTEILVEKLLGDSNRIFIWNLCNCFAMCPCLFPLEPFL